MPVFTAADEQIDVIYSAVSRAPLPFGEDAFLLDLLVSQTRKIGSPEVTFDTLKDLLRFVGASGGGHDYKRLRDRVDRISGLHIRIERTKQVAVNIRLVDIQNVEETADPAWKRIIERRNERAPRYAFRFAPEFYEDLMRHYTVIPLQLLQAFAGSPIEYSIARWIYRRVIRTQKPTLVRWSEIYAERGGGDSNPRRTRAYARSVIRRLKVVWWIVVGDVRPRVGLGDAEVGKQEGHRLGSHRGAAVGVQGQGTGLDALARARFFDQLLRQRCTLTLGDHPADNVAAEDVEDYVEVEVRPFRRAVQLGDVPAPHLVRPGREQLGLLVLGMPKLVAAFTDLVVVGEDSVHRAQRAEVAALVEQAGVDLWRREVNEARLCSTAMTWSRSSVPSARGGRRRQPLTVGRCRR